MQPQDTTGPTKTCSKCGRTLPATTEFFYTNRGACRECHAKQTAAYRAIHLVACPACNQSKGAKHPTEWAGRLC